MQTLLHFIQNIDLNIYYWLSQFHGSWFLDRFVAFQESNTLLKCGLLTSMYCYFWFHEDVKQQQRRGQILTILTGTLAGLALTRVVATLMPFRVRPMYAANFQQHALSIPTPGGFIDWSSFPSDHAAYLWALGFGLIWMSRRFTVPVVLYLVGWVCLPRMYLGIHYASDLAVGAVIGVATVWLSLNTAWIASKVSRPLLAFSDAKPQIFYTFAFLGMYEMTTLFWDIQAPVHAASHALSHIPHHKVVAAGLVLLATLFVAWLIVLRRAYAESEKVVPQPMLAKAASAIRS